MRFSLGIVCALTAPCLTVRHCRYGDRRDFIFWPNPVLVSGLFLFVCFLALLCSWYFILLPVLPHDSLLLLWVACNELEELGGFVIRIWFVWMAIACGRSWPLEISLSAGVILISLTAEFKFALVLVNSNSASCCLPGSVKTGDLVDGLE